MKEKANLFAKSEVFPRSHLTSSLFVSSCAGGALEEFHGRHQNMGTLPPHGEPGVLPGFPSLPVRAVRAGVHGVRAGDAALPPPLPARPQRVLQAHGDVRGRLARGYGVHQVPRLRRALPSPGGPQLGRRAHGGGPDGRAEGLRLLVSSGAENGPGAGLLLPEGPRLLPSLPQHVLPPGGAVLRPLLHRRHLHRLPLGHLVHLPDLPHRRHALPLPGAAHHLLRRLLHDGVPHLLRRLPAGGPGGLQRLQPLAVQSLHGDPGLAQQGLHHALHGALLLHHGRQRLVGHPHHHLVPGRRAQVGQRGHREEGAALPRQRLGHPRHAHRRPAGHEQDRGRQHQRRVLRRPLRRGRAALLRAGASLPLRGGGGVPAAGRNHLPQPRPHRDPAGEGEPGQAGEVHDPHRRLQRALPRAPAGGDRLLLLRAGVPGRVGDHVDPGALPGVPHPLSLPGHSDEPPRPDLVPDEVPDGLGGRDPLGVLGWKQENLPRRGGAAAPRQRGAADRPLAAQQLPPAERAVPARQRPRPQRQHGGHAHQPELLESEFLESELLGSEFLESELPGFELPESELLESEFLESELPGSEFLGSELPESELLESELPGSELRCRGGAGSCSEEPRGTPAGRRDPPCPSRASWRRW
ncbi:hypothetical protein RLOC_00013714 [Lonchura striata]|uniref:Uncharacterized protein n=1 Tax=Lonchura striata TaxID=40157 RepID=A0A218U8U8_9PASE|nr:hypothetical protein RLOC_00013714 [Lonchura striata domestica]